MLLARFYESVAGHSPEEDGVHIIDIRGLSFKRYLEIAQLTGNKVAVMTDNDGDFQKHCVNKYAEFIENANIGIFYDSNNAKRTFEIVLYSINSALCDELFGNDAQNFMLNNKTEAAYALLSQEQDIAVPCYIERAINWIKE